MTSRPLILLAISIFSSCSTSQYIFSTDGFQNIEQLTVDEAAKWHIDKGHKDISPGHLISIGEGIYPNLKKFTLATPRIFEKETRGFRLETQFFYTPKDNLVRAILYQWDKSGTGNQRKQFQMRYDQLRKSLTDKLGQPKEIEINQKKFNDQTFRDGIKWTGKVNAYLFMFGNDRTGYRQIRLAVYSE